MNVEMFFGADKNRSGMFSKNIKLIFNLRK